MADSVHQIVPAVFDLEDTFQSNIVNKSHSYRYGWMDRRSIATTIRMMTPNNGVTHQCDLDSQAFLNFSFGVER